jgi:ABC-2 type transport system ATP-binding protein
MSVLQVNKLFKSYGDIRAVNDVSFSIARGEIVGLLGPNGAGKTTTINMILGVLEPTNGKIVIDGADISEERSRALARTNFAAVYAAVPGNLTVYQNLRVFGLLYGVQNLKKRVAEVIQEYDLERFVNAKAGVLSSGEQTRVALAKAMLNKPALLLLDEPTASLDPATAREVRERIKNYASSGQGGMLWTSHNMHEVTETCDRVLFVSHGKILLEGDPKKLPAEYGKKDLEELFIAVAREPLSLTE